MVDLAIQGVTQIMKLALAALAARPALSQF